MLFIRLLFIALTAPVAVWAYPATVAEVFDGDTLLTTQGEHIRLVQINSPEVAHENSPAQPFGEDAKRYLKTKLQDQVIEVKPAKKKTDKYKRTLAEVYHEGKLVNAEMLAAGLAHVYTFPDNNNDVKTLTAIEDKARLAKKGIWQSPRWQVKSATGNFADEWIGQFHIVDGKVTSVVPMKDRVYLNFGSNWREDFTVEIPQKFMKKFAEKKINPITAYKGKTLRVRGILKPVNGVMVTATHPAQLEVLP